MTAIPHIDKKDAIQAALLRLAKVKPTYCLTYTDFGARVGIQSRGPWKGVLDLIASEEMARGLPDVTLLVINKKTGYPSQIGFKSAKPPSEAQKKRAREEFQKIVDRYSPGSPNPF